MPITSALTSPLTRSVTQGLFGSAVAILDSLGIVPQLAASMTRNLVAYSGAYYALSGSDVATVYDQSAFGRNLTSDGTGALALSGSGDSARAVFSDTGYGGLDTDTTGASFPAGGHDVFLVFDPLGSSDQQILFSRGSTANDVIVMDNGSGSAVVTGLGIGDIRVNDAIISTPTRDELWDAMNDPSGLNVFSAEDLVMNDFSGTVRISSNSNTWRIEGSFAELIITPPLSDADHSAIVADIVAFYG